MGEQVERPYVPVLRAKQGEFDAVAQLRDAERTSVRPLFELAPQTIQTKNGERVRKPLDRHLVDQAQSIANATADFPEVWIDDRCSRPDEVPGTSQHPLTYAFDAFEDANSKYIPVLSPSRPSVYVEAAIEQARRAKRLVLRLTPRDVYDQRSAARLIKGLLTPAKLSPDLVDLVLDVAPFSPDQSDSAVISTAAVVPHVPFVNDWRTFTMVTTSMPQRPFEVVANNTHEHLPRACWQAWMQIQTTSAPRLPGFGDYAIDNPKTDLDREFYGPAVPMIRYTTDESWVLYRGTGKPKGSAPREVDWPELSRRLVASPYYRGPEFSAGDQFIKECAEGAPKHGGGTSWRRVGVNHHITQVVEQLTNLP